MSGSLVLRSGVGTQMLIVSSSSTAEKSVVARSFPDSTSGASVELGISPIYDSPAFTMAVFCVADIDAGYREPGLGELHRQRQAHISQADDSHARPARSDLVLEQRGSRFGC